MKGYLLKDVDTGTKDDAGNPVMTTELWDASAIEVKDAKTLVLNLSQPQVAVPEHLFHYPFLMLDPAENGVFGAGSNGTESFELAELEVGRKAVLKRRKDAPGYVDELQFIDLGDNPAAVAAALASKQVDGIYQGNVEQIDLYKGMAHVDIHEAVTAQTGVARMRLDHPPFDKPQVRRPCGLPRTQKDAADRPQKRRPGGRASPCLCESSRLQEAQPMARNGKRRSFSPKPDFRMASTSKSSVSPTPSWEQAAVEAMAEQWKKAGIRAKINVMPSNKFYRIWDNAVRLHRMDASAARLHGAGARLSNRGAMERSAYSNAKFDELLAKAEGTLDIDTRREIPRRTREDHAGRWTDRSAFVAFGLCRIRQARAGPRFTRRFTSLAKRWP
jgi:peptide/nickel transport system substrate-binding protein